MNQPLTKIGMGIVLLMRIRVFKKYTLHLVPSQFDLSAENISEMYRFRGWLQYFSIWTSKNSKYTVNGQYKTKR